MVSIPAEIGSLAKLESLNLSGNRLAIFPGEICRLESLISLNLENNQLASIPKEINDLINLKLLDLSGNRITELPNEVSGLTKLRGLNLDGNPILVFPAQIVDLPDFHLLYLDSTQLRNWADAIIKLKGVTLYVRNIEDRSFDVISLEIISGFNTGQDLIDYFFRAQGSEGGGLNEAKIIVIGQGNVGKTSLCQRLMGELYQSLGRTEGVEIKKWETKVVNSQTGNLEWVKLNIWDFGGQEVYHTTHQFFFRSRCIYLVVIDARLGITESRLHYWLRQAQAFGGDAPVIVVLNKAEDNATLDRRYEKDRDAVLSLRSIFPAIFDCILVSCEYPPLEIDKVEEAIGAVITEKMPEVFSAIPENWLKVKQRLEESLQNYLDETEFEEMCADIPEEERKRLIETLDALGVIISFEEGRCADTNVIKPEWITKGIYKILSSYILDEKNGRISHEEIQEIFRGEGDYPPRQVEYILRLMEKHDLCFIETSPNGERSLLFPVAFSVRELKHQPLGASTTHLEFSYENEYYDSIIVRFLKNAYKSYGPDFFYWRKGLMGRFGPHQIYVRADEVSNKIEVRIDGAPGERFPLLDEIISTIDDIHNDFGELTVEKTLFHPKNNYAFSYENVLKRWQNGKNSIGYIDAQGDAVNISIEYLIEGIISEEIKEEEVAEEIGKLENSIRDLRITHDRELEDRNEKIVSLQRNINSLINGLEKAVEDSEKIKEGLDSEASKIVKLYAIGSFLAVSLVLLGWISLMLWVDWNVMDKANTIAGILILITYYGFVAFTLKEPNPLRFLERLFEKSKNKLYIEFSFDLASHEARKQQLVNFQKLTIVEKPNHEIPAN